MYCGIIACTQVSWPDRAVDWRIDHTPQYDVQPPTRYVPQCCNGFPIKPIGYFPYFQIGHGGSWTLADLLFDLPRNLLQNPGQFFTIVHLSTFTFTPSSTSHICQNKPIPYTNTKQLSSKPSSCIPTSNHHHKGLLFTAHFIWSSSSPWLAGFLIHS